MARHLHIHIHDCYPAPTGVTTDVYDPAEHPRGGRGQFGYGPGKPFQRGEHPRNEGGTFVQGSHPGERSERQKRERTDLVANKKD
jgi:hypothetical protein